MSAGDSLSPHQFRHEFETSTFDNAGGGTFNQISAFHGDESIGRMSWVTTPDTSEIRDIQVRPDFQRKGVASGMFAAGRAMADLHGVREPKHSSDRTDEGDAWAKSVSPKKSVPARPKYLPRTW